MVSLGALGSVEGNGATDVSASGSTIVGYSNDKAFRWTSADGIVGLGLLPGDDFSYASGVADNGSVIFGVSFNTDDNHSEAFRWTNIGGMEGLGFLPGGSRSSASAVSADGFVIVGASSREAFRWTSSGGMVGLGFLAGKVTSAAYDISADGSVIVGYSGDGSGGDEAFRWTLAGGMAGLGFLSGGIASYAKDISSDGSVIVGVSEDANGISSAFIWDITHGMRSLSEVLTASGMDLTGWTLDYANGISADGTAITGGGIHNGVDEAWIITGLTAVPEPATWALFLGGGLWLFLIHRKRRQAG